MLKRFDGGQGPSLDISIERMLRTILAMFGASH